MATTTHATEKQLLALAEIKRYERILDIAKDGIFGLQTLEARHSDDLDIHEVSVWTLKKMLEKAYEAGYEETLYETARNDAMGPSHIVCAACGFELDGPVEKCPDCGATAE